MAPPPEPAASTALRDCPFCGSGIAVTVSLCANCRRFSKPLRLDSTASSPGGKSADYFIDQASRAGDELSRLSDNAKYFIDKHSVYAKAVIVILASLVFAGYIAFFGYRSQNENHDGGALYWVLRGLADAFGLFCFSGLLFGVFTRFWLKPIPNGARDEGGARSDVAPVTSLASVIVLLPLIADMRVTASIASIFAIVLNFCFRPRSEWKRWLWVSVVPIGTIVWLCLNVERSDIVALFCKYDLFLAPAIRIYITILIVLTTITPLHRFVLNGVAVGRARGDVLVRLGNSRAWLPLGSSMAALFVLCFAETAFVHAGLFRLLVRSWI
jgi:hypothetical protein